MGVSSQVSALYLPHPLSLLSASCRKSIGKHQQANATAGAKAAPSSVVDRKIVKKESAFAAVKSPPWTGCGTPPGGVRVLSNPLQAPLYHVRPFRRSQVHCSLAGGALGRPPRGRQGWPTPESWDDGDLTRKCNWKSPTIWGIHMLITHS